MQKKDASSDDLFEVRNAFYIGNYQHCINEASKIRGKCLEKDLFVYRSYIALQKYRIVLDEISQSDATSLFAVRKLAEYFSDPAKAETIVKYFDDKLATPVNDLEDIWVIAAATVYYNEGIYESALKILHTADGLECKALQIQTLLKIHRPDVAKKVYQQMQEIDDDATLTQLAHAWLSIEIGGDKLQDAYYIFQDFADKFSPSIQLLNSQAVCNIGQQKFEDAESVLRECLERNSNHYDTLVNLIIASQHTEKGHDIMNRHLTNLKDSHSNSPLVMDYLKKENEFDRLCLQYGPTNKTPIEYV